VDHPRRTAADSFTLNAYIHTTASVHERLAFGLDDNVGQGERYVELLDRVKALEEIVG
jgi:hypothetical protein